MCPTARAKQPVRLGRLHFLLVRVRLGCLQVIVEALYMSTSPCKLLQKSPDDRVARQVQMATHLDDVAARRGRLIQVTRLEPVDGGFEIGLCVLVMAELQEVRHAITAQLLAPAPRSRIAAPSL